MLKDIPNKVWVLALSFVLATTSALIFEFYYLFALPAVLAIVLLSLYRYDYLMAFIVFATPLSFNFERLALGGIGFYFPTEPLLFGLLILFILQCFRKSPVEKRVFDHIISIAILVNLFWIGVTTYTSEIPVVSFKFLVARLWFVLIMFFLATQLFKDYPRIRQFVWLYLIPLTGVVVYTLVNHGMHGFAEEPAHWVMSPFFKDHTSYGAVLAMYYPIAWILLVKGRYPFWVKGVLVAVVTILSLGLIFSYTRAAWVSLIGAMIVFAFMYFRVPFVWVATIGLVLIGLFFVYQDQLMYNMEKNRQESSDQLAEHVESISNISSDASNLERLNRWSSALRMFAEKPYFGFGPGTYMFLYAPYQKNSEKTIISTNSGDVGNAHSEYLGPLSESGVLGMLTVLFLIGVVVHRGVVLYSSLADSDVRNLVLGLLLGLITYFIHGILNNYLDTDKASIPFWSFIAGIVAIDLWHKKGRLSGSNE